MVPVTKRKDDRRRSSRPAITTASIMGNRHPCPPAPSSSPSSSPASDDAPAPTTTSPPSPRPLPPNFVPLLGHTTLDAHEDAVRAALAIAARRSDLGGEEGLRELGFEFRSVPCIEHRAEEAEAADDGDEGADEGCDEGGGSSSTDEGEEAPPRSPDVLPPPNDRSDPSPNSTASNESVATRSTSALSLWSDCVGESNDRFSGGSACCPRCATRLFYVGRSAAPSDADGRPAASKPPVRSIPREGSREEDRGEEAAGFDEPTTDSERRRRRGEERPGQRQQQESEQPQRLEDGPEAVMITDDNRRRYIADGAMYELVATLAQEAAQSILCKTFDLVWVTVCDERHLGERVRAMVDRDHGSLLEEDETLRVASELVCGRDHDDHADEKKEEGDDDEADRRRRTEPPASADEAESTLLVATGRGKVRAGIFSRRHLLTAGIETGTSWRCVREARARKWGVAIVDPNARGEGAGYDTFRRSVRRLFPGGASGGGGDDAAVDAARAAPSAARAPEPPPANDAPGAASSPIAGRGIYVLAHSASGGQLVRHLREDPTILPSLRAVAFTDSTHNVQWCKRHPALRRFLQEENCVYLRSNGVRSSQSCVKVSSRGKDVMCPCAECDASKASGTDAETDEFWRHRFGTVKTVWAGTADHSLSNLAGHESIWDHFDERASVGDGGGG